MKLLKWLLPISLQKRITSLMKLLQCLWMKVREDMPTMLTDMQSLCVLALKQSSVVLQHLL